VGKLLASVLENYYQEKGNSFVFANGMTLNELAVEMDFRLNEKYGESFDNSILSRARKGKRTLTHTQAEIFCEILAEALEIDIEEIYHQVIFAIAQDLLWRYGIVVKSSANPKDFDLKPNGFGN
jgi:hypothetical protein